MAISSVVKSFIVFIALCDTVRCTGYDKAFCKDLNPQYNIDMSQIMGMWYGVERIDHLRAEDEGIFYHDSCPIIHLSEIQYELSTTESYLRPGSYGYKWTQERYGIFDREYQHIRLYWDESGNSQEYYLKYNSSRKGFWIASGPHSGDRAGAMLQIQYNKFAGTVQVMKAVIDHLVLTICQRLPESRLYTVILSREPQQIGRQVLHSIHNYLNRRDLTTLNVKKLCRNGSGSNKSSLTLVLFTIMSAITYLGKNII